MRTHVILRYTGVVLLFNAVFLFLSALVSVFYSDDALFPLLYSAGISALFGAFPMLFVPPTADISHSEGFIIVIASWLLACLGGVMPYVLWGGPFTFINALFESVSGFTTTGSSILSEIETLPLGLLFWRSCTHWIGGIGIVIFVLSVLPSMGKAGMVLYEVEMSSVAKDNFNYRTKQILKILLYVYVGLTLLEIIFLMLCGMNLYDAVTHTFATIATGGFSTKNLSIAHYNSVSIEAVIIVFMVLSGMNFGLLYGAVFGRIGDLWKSEIVRYYLFALFTGVLITTLSIHSVYYGSWFEAFRYSCFQVVSLGTSTGFATADTSGWPSLAQLILILFTLQCACAGSTSGGIKVDRLVILWKAFRKNIVEMKHPRAVVTPKINKVPVREGAIEAGLLYISIYIAIVFISSVLLTALGIDSVTAFSGSAATMGNVGPGFGSVGSMSNFSHMPDAGKLILTANMLLGRLEIFGVILFFTARSWR